MSAAHDTRVCERFERWLTAYVDAELDAVHCLEVEEHIASCDGCHEFIEHMERTRSSLRSVSRDIAAPSSLRKRVSATLLDARLAEAGPLHERPMDAGEGDGSVDEELPLSMREPDTGSVRPAATAVPPSLVNLRYIVPLAAAATIALVFGAMRLQQPQEQPVADNDAREVVSTASSLPTTPVAAQAVAWNMFLDGLAQRHLQPPALETFDPKGVEEYAPHIGVRVSSPRMRDAQWVGARLETNAALIRFIRQNRKPVTVFVFDPRRVYMQPTPALRRRIIDHEAVLAGKVRGVAVAASEQNGVGYALATDDSVDEAVRLVLTAAR